MAHSHTNLLYHIVFATKDCRPMLMPPAVARLHAYLGGSIREEGGTALIVNGTADHVHILARLRQDKGKRPREPFLTGRVSWRAC